MPLHSVCVHLCLCSPCLFFFEVSQKVSFKLIPVSRLIRVSIVCDRDRDRQVEGYKMRDGSSANEHREHASNNDPVVERLRTLGAVVLGTTSMTEGGVTPLGYCVAEKVKSDAYPNQRSLTPVFYFHSTFPLFF